MSEQPTTYQAFDILKRAILADPGYAWSWHCNFAMPIYDSGVDHEIANKAAARLMEHIFQADIKVYSPEILK